MYYAKHYNGILITMLSLKLFTKAILEQFMQWTEHRLKNGLSKRPISNVCLRLKVLKMIHELPFILLYSS